MAVVEPHPREVAKREPAAGGVPLAVEGLRKRFAPDQPEVLKGIDLLVSRGEIVALLGANGCGKSTLLRCAIRLLDPDSGRVMLEGRDVAGLDGAELRRARRAAALVFQSPALVRRRSAFHNVCLGGVGALPLRRSFAGSVFPDELKDSAARALNRVGLADQAWQRAGTLSGGQAQRVSIARACCQQAAIVLADEPVSALDPRAAEDVLGLLASLAHDDGLSVLVVLHQPELALRHADRVAGMVRGAVAFDRAARDVSPHDVAALYADEPA